MQGDPFDEGFVKEKEQQAIQQFGIKPNEVHYFCFTGETTNTAYQPKEETIKILFKDGSVKDISEVDHTLIQQNLSSAVKKFYICLLT
jgi:uncharacterized protein